MRDSTQYETGMLIVSPKTSTNAEINLDMFCSGPLIPEMGQLPVYSDGRTNTVDRRDHPPHEPTGTTEVLTFYPTLEEFRDFVGYVKKIESVGAHTKCGICKIVPPEGWTPRPTLGNSFSDLEDFEINSPVKETIEGRSGVFMKQNRVYRKKMTVRDFRKLAQSATFKNPKPHLSGIDLETEFFKNINFGEPIYGADTEGSIYEENVDEFNMNRLKTILDDTKIDGKVIKDMDLYSINYLHHGAPKYWFAISSESADRFERLMIQLFPEYNSSCNAFLRHKHFIITPSLLRAHNIPYGTMIQRPNEFIITFPKGYHMGFNTGYNIAESTNFAMDRWIDFGKNAPLCNCRPDRVEIDMRPFMKKYRPDEYEQWYNYWYEPRTVAVVDSERKKSIQKRKIPKKELESMGREIVSKRRRRELTRSAPQTDYSSSGTPSSQDSDETLFPESLASTSSSSSLVANDAFSNYDLTCSIDFEPDSDLLRQNFQKFGDLHAFTPYNLFTEKKYNETSSQFWPHCAVCSYFQPIHMRPRTNQCPSSSKRLMKDLCFSKRNKVVADGEEPTEDVLITCENCRVTVHPRCYNGQRPKNSAKWLCMRCRARSDVAIRATSCAFCEMRAGAFIPCTVGSDRGFAHVICAIFNRLTYFDQGSCPKSCFVYPPPKQGNLTPRTQLPLHYVMEYGKEHERAKFECEVCRTSREGLIPCTNCFEEAQLLEAFQVPTLAHVTCARQVGFFLEQRDFPKVAVMVCDRHKNLNSIDSDNLSPIKPGEEVLYSEGASLERCSVLSVIVKHNAVVEFCDGSITRDLSLTDIISCDCIQCDKVQHQLGSKLKVQWEENTLYDGFFRGICSTKDYKVRFSNGTVNSFCRSKLFSTNDDISPQMRRILSSS
ncbi:unnamed protein product [Caenorhabditis auriculariae]|uniref:[histone H3]-trimethyl-L-lysine(9) demethylase n=1 Tax=Caenorhabditis auriculariae TaxID=2777116 RepID=A0A8S1HQT6_9PELO|nr:unnamed protein product [Caenorhabditis auriculariae]